MNVFSFTDFEASFVIFFNDKFSKKTVFDSATLYQFFQAAYCRFDDFSFSRMSEISDL